MFAFCFVANLETNTNKQNNKEKRNCYKNRTSCFTNKSILMIELFCFKVSCQMRFQSEITACSCVFIGIFKILVSKHFRYLIWRFVFTLNPIFVTGQTACKGANQFTVVKSDSKIFTTLLLGPRHTSNVDTENTTIEYFKNS